MEIVPIFSQAEAMQPLELLASLGTVLVAIYLAVTVAFRAARAAFAGITLARPALPMIARAALSFTASMAPVRSIATTDAKWSRPPRFETSEFPLPPRSLVRAGDNSGPTRTMPGRVHPAVHGSVRDYNGEPLLPRATGTGVTAPRPPRPTEDEAIRRGISDLRRATRVAHRRNPEGLSERTPNFSHYAVLPGDTLWGIAGKVLGTDDLRVIARYWPRIHRENRDVIGPNPDLIRPGQVLSLPPIIQS